MFSELVTVVSTNAGGSGEVKKIITLSLLIGILKNERIVSPVNIGLKVGLINLESFTYPTLVIFVFSQTPKNAERIGPVELELFLTWIA